MANALGFPVVSDAVIAFVFFMVCSVILIVHFWDKWC